MSDDFSELFDLAADLTSAGEKVVRNVEKAIEVTARHIKDDWRQGAEVAHHGHKNFAPAYAYAIDYELKYPGGEIDAEIGPSLGKTKGAGAGFLEDAPGGVDSAPQHAGRDALEANEPDFYRGLEIAVFDATVEAVEGS